ncbi:MAG: hypothetical protein DRJ42_12130 [Deltaproteobacteria bacterium]|nr:MAG: hypothetical protein DRJ42_12130 [Deltaproteobacteria bacterium]
MKATDPYVDWLLDTFDWLVRERGGGPQCLLRNHLVTPTEDDFPVADLEGFELAQDYFAFVREHAQVGALQFELEVVDAANPGAVLKGVPHGLTETPKRTEPAERIPVGEPLPIQCLFDDVLDPTLFIARTARGIAHYWVQAARSPHPGGPSSFEFAVDITSTFLGFGIFAANRAMAFQQHQEGFLVGWSTQRYGALSELELSHALAAFALLHTIEPESISRHLTGNPRAYFKKALKTLQPRLREIQELRTLDVQHSPYRTGARDTSRFDANHPPEEELAAESPIEGVRCPACAYIPDSHDWWACDCGCEWNTFLTRGTCPQCHKQWEETWCPSCDNTPKHEAWYVE